MSKNIKKPILILIFISLILIFTILTFFIVRHFQNKARIKNVLNIYLDENVQERIDNKSAANETFTVDDLMLKIDGKNVIGVIDIDRINYKGLIYEGTSLSTLAKGVGHFTNSPYLLR